MPARFKLASSKPETPEGQLKTRWHGKGFC